MSTTLTGPRSFRATLNRREKTERYAPHNVIVEAATFTFDAADAVGKAEQRALFADYTATAGELGYKLPRAEAHPRRVQYAVGGEWFDAPKFTARPMAANERHWLGREVGFRPYNSNVFAPVAGGVRANGHAIIHGTVWSLSPYPKAFWVYVEGSGFYSVSEADFRVGVNA